VGTRALGWTVGLLLLSAVAQAQASRPSGRGFIFGGAVGGGQMSFGGAEDLALALSPVDGQETIASWGSTTTYDVRSAWVVRKGESAPGAEHVVPFAGGGAGGFSMHGGYAFSSRVAVLMDVGVWAGGSSRGFNQAVGSFMARVSPVARVWVEAGPAFSDLGYGYEGSVVRSGTLKGSGMSAVLGLTALRRARWSLDIEARYSRIAYDAGFSISTATVQLGASRMPLRVTAGS
jgi:hypothetical protein